MNIILTQEISPFAKIIEKHDIEACSPIKIRTAWQVNDNAWDDNAELGFMQTAKAVKPASMMVDGEWKGTEVLAPASKYSMICEVANAFCEYTGLQLFKTNYMLAHPELAGTEVPRDPAHNERLCHMCVKAMFGCYPDEMNEAFLDDLCHYTNWEVLKSDMQVVGAGEHDEDASAVGVADDAAAE